MNKNRILEHLCTLAATLLMSAGCSQNELGNEQGEPLPEGKYPIEFTATGLQATPQTRATADGTWTKDDPIAIKIGDDVKKYNATSLSTSITGGANGTSAKFTSTSPFYWQSKDPIYVSAWYYGTEYNATPPTAWTVQSDQNTEGNYQKSDFLYAKEKLSYNGSQVLHFFHQTAKVVVHIIDGSQTPEDITVESMTIGDESNVHLNGGWTAPNGHWVDGKSVLGTWKEHSQPNTSAITPKNLGKKEVTVDGQPKTSLASYQALVIPQSINASSKLFKIDIEGYSPFYYTVPAGGITWQPGTEHIYYITIKGSKLEVIASSSIGWSTEGSTSGSGSVMLPEIIDLSTKSATISDDGIYRISSNGQETANTITITSGSPTVYLENVNIKAAEGGGINITGGSPTLIIQGADNRIVSTMDSGIALSNGANVTITGTSNDKLTVEGGGSTATSGVTDDLAQGAGIGSAKGAECGNITIKNIQLVAKGSYQQNGNSAINAAAIGTSNNGSCGNITIENATIEVSVGPDAAAIGLGARANSMGDINIINSIVETSTAYAACIGFPHCFNLNNSFNAGKITITTDDIDTFLSNLTINSDTPYKIGKGRQAVSGVYKNKGGTGDWEGVDIIVDGKTTHYADGVSEIKL